MNVPQRRLLPLSPRIRLSALICVLLLSPFLANTQPSSRINDSHSNFLNIPSLGLSEVAQAASPNAVPSALQSALPASVWPYRVPLTVNANGYQRDGKIAEATMNFTSLLNQVGDSGAMAIESLRLVEIDGSGNIIDANVPFQFDQDAAYDPSTNALGTLVFQMVGSTSSSGQRSYHLYFGPAGLPYQPASVDAQITATTTGVQDEGANSYRFETASATLFYDTGSGGFSSINDADGNDWINYSTASGVSGEFRGIPNLIHPEGGFHPGDGGSVTELLNVGPLKASYTSTDGNWQALWEIYPDYATMTLLQTDHDYWFLYEGTPGGALETDDYYVLSTDATQFNAYTDTSNTNDPDIAGEEWIYFVDPSNPTGPRSLFLVHHEDDNFSDSYRRIGNVNDGNAMTAFGFGRQNVTKLMSQVPQTFTLGLMETDDYTAASTIINSAYRDLSISLGSAEASAASGTPGQAKLVAPSGTVNTATPTYEWIATPAASDYNLAIYSVSQDAIVHMGSYASTNICTGTTCSVQPAVPLASGLYKWLTQATNSAGVGPWTTNESTQVSAAWVELKQFNQNNTLYLPFQPGMGKNPEQPQGSAQSQVVTAALVGDCDTASPPGDIPCDDGLPYTVDVATNSPPAVTIAGPADGATFTQGDAVSFSGTANDAEDGDISANLAWSSSIDGSIGSGASFSTSSLSVGSHTITANVTDSGGSSSSASILVTVTSGNSNGGPSIIYVSSTTSGSVDGINFADEDILAYNIATDTWTLFFDGSAYGLTGASDIDGFAIMDDGSLLLSLWFAFPLPGFGEVDDSDILKLNPSTGVYEMFIDGSTVDLTSNAEDVSAFSLLPDGSIVVSTYGTLNAGGVNVGTDEDLMRYDPTTGTWSLYFDGSDVGMAGTDDMDVRGVWVDPSNGDLLMTTRAAFTVDGVSGATEDIFVCSAPTTGSNTSCGSVAIEWLGTDLAGEELDAIAFGGGSSGGNTAPSVSIAAPANGASFAQGNTVSFSGTANDIEDGDISSGLTWNSNIDGSIGSGASFSTSSLSVGSHIITASVTDSDGTSSDASVSVTITSGGTSGTRSIVYVSSTTSGNVDGIAFADEDVLAYDIAADSWSLFFDGSAYGLGATDLDGFTIADDGSILLSLWYAFEVPGLGIVDDSDILRLNPATDQLELYFVGANAEMTANAEDISAFALLPDGSIVVSTYGTLNAGGVNVGTDEDLMRYDPTTGAWSLYFDGSDVGMAGTDNMDVQGVWVDPSNGDLLMTTRDVFTVNGVAGSISGGIRDIFVCGAPTTGSNTSCNTVSIEWSGDDISSEVLDAIAFGSSSGGSNTPPTVNISAPADGSSLTQGNNVAFSGTATDAEDGDISASLTWSSSLDGAIGSGASFNTSSLSVGTHTITASATDSSGSSDSDSITVTINAPTDDPPVVAISAPADGSSFTQGESVAFVGTATDPEDGDISANLTWSSSLDGAIGSGASFNTSALSVGTHTVIASATDSGGNSDSASITVTINAPTDDPPVVTISAPADGSSFTQGDSASFAGTATDPEDGDISANLTWSSSLDGAIGSGASFNTSTLSVGTHTITASATDSGGNSADSSIQLTVTSVSAGGQRSVVYVSTITGGTVDGITFADEDILAYDRTTDSWSLFFDGSLHGLGSTDVDGFAILGDNSLLLSPKNAIGISGLGTVDDSDIVRFIPATGEFEMYLDGSTVGLTTSSEDISAFALLPDGSLIASAYGTINVNGAFVANDEDLARYDASTDSWAVFFDGSDVGMGGTDNMDIQGVWVDPSNNDILITTKSAFTVNGVSGSTVDIFACTSPTTGSNTSCDTVTIEWSGDDISSEVLDAIAFGPSSSGGNASPNVNITAPANNASFTPGSNVSFTGTATDLEDGDISASLTWSSNLDGAIGSGASFNTSALSAGTHIITASATDSGGSSDSDSITVTIATSQCTAPSNLAPQGTATQSSGYNGNQFPASLAIDGNYGNFTHTQASQSPASWQVNLGEDVLINEITLHNRSSASSRLRDITVTVIDATGTTTYESTLLNPENVLNSPSQITVDLVALTGSHVVGQTVLVTRTPDPDLSGGGGGVSEPNVLSLAEVEVFACAIGSSAASVNSVSRELMDNLEEDSNHQIFVPYFGMEEESTTNIQGAQVEPESNQIMSTTKWYLNDPQFRIFLPTVPR